MSIVLSVASTSTGPSTATTTAGVVLGKVASDIVQALGEESPILLDYVDRVQKEILRQETHPFLLSSPKRFVTQMGIAGYWFGATGSAPTGLYDTGLNITDFRSIKEDEVIDRTNDKLLYRVPQNPPRSDLSFDDGTSVGGRPLMWQANTDVLGSLYLYPVPDNQNTYEPVPPGPICTTAVSGALAARTYYVKQTLVDDAGGESLPCTEAVKIRVPANSVLLVKPPSISPTITASGIQYTNYKVYVSTTEGSETLQSSSVSLSANWQEPGTGLVAGAALPTTSSIEPLGGYVIEFRYYKSRGTVTSTADVLQVPDDYRDVVIAGVNWLAFTYLRNWNEAGSWNAIYRQGLQAITRDKNQTFRYKNYISPGK